MKSFKYDGLDLVYKQADHLISLTEVLLLDTYRADLLKKDDTVVDLGAGIGDFSVLASRKVGPNGKVIALEPHVEDYEMLKMNVERNGCVNVIALNIGVAEPGEKEISFWGRKYSFMTDTPENLLARKEIKKIDFVKMDIEGFELEVIKNSFRTIGQADVISIELHGTKDKVDRMLRPRFVFRHTASRRACEKFISSLLAHPRAVLEVLLFIDSLYPKILHMRINQTREKNCLITGIYVKPEGRTVTIQ